MATDTPLRGPAGSAAAQPGAGVAAAAAAAQPAGAAAAADTLPRYIEVGSALEFSRLVCALEHIPRVSFLHDHGGRPVLSTRVDLLKDRPIMYYAPFEGDGSGHYLSYALRGGREESRVVSSAGDASSAYSPIVRIKSLPASLRQGNGAAGGAYHPVVLEDMASLVKLSCMGEDVPFPVFAFPRGGKWLVGVFMMFDEEGESYFCHVCGDEEPRRPFIRFSANDGGAPSFADAPADHGYAYVKVIRLRGEHPLVDYGQL